MIIECQSCHARFRLDATRIRGKGARVKCRRCGESIIVLLEGRQEEAPQAPVSGGFLDLGSAIRDSLPAPAAGAAAGISAALPDNLIPFPGPAKAQEPISPEAPFPGEAEPPPRPDPFPLPDAGGARDEVDLAFERLLSGPVMEPAPPAPPPEAFPHPEPEVGEAIGGALQDGPGAVPGPAEETDMPFLETHQHPAGGKTPSYQGEGRGDGGFLLSESDTLDFLKVGLRQEERPAAEEKPSADISFILTTSPVDETASSLRTQTPAAISGTGSAIDISSRLEAAPAAEPSDGMTLEGNETPLSPAPEVPVPPLREEIPPPPRTETRAPSSPEPSRPRSALSPSRIAAAGFAVLLLAGFGYFGFTPSGRKAVEAVAPGAWALLGGKPGTAGRPEYDVRNVIGYYETGAGGRRILVIKGQVANLSSKEKSGIRVFAAILDSAEKVLAEQSVYAGNVIPGDRLRKIDPPGARKALDNRFGEGLANMNVGSGKSVPFMVVFFDAPENIDSYRLEARDGE